MFLHNFRKEVKRKLFLILRLIIYDWYNLYFSSQLKGAINKEEF